MFRTQGASFSGAQDALSSGAQGASSSGVQNASDLLSPDRGSDAGSKSDETTPAEEGDEKALEKWRAALIVHKRFWRRIGKLLSLYKDSSGLLLAHQWPEKSDVWGETVFTRVSKRERERSSLEALADRE